MKHTVTYPNRVGYTDAIMGRPPKTLYDNIPKAKRLYHAGYELGETMRQQYGIIKQMPPISSNMASNEGRLS